MAASATLTKLELYQKVLSERPRRELAEPRTVLSAQEESPNWQLFSFSHIQPRSPGAEKLQDLRGATVRAAPGMPLMRSGP